MVVRNGGPSDPEAYITGFAVCSNNASSGPLAAPRADDDYTSPPNLLPEGPLNPTPDSLGPTLLGPFLTSVGIFAGIPFVAAGNLAYTGDPLLEPAQRQTVPARWAELQAFNNAGRMQVWFALLGHSEATSGQDKNRRP